VILVCVSPPFFCQSSPNFRAVVRPRLAAVGGLTRVQFVAIHTEETDEIADEDELLPPAEADELSGFPNLTAVVVQHYVREEKCAVALIGITSDRGEFVGDQVPPDDPRAKGWMVLLHHPNGSSAAYADLIWRDRAAAEAFIQEAASYSESIIEPPYPESITEPPASDPTEQSGDGSPEPPPADPSPPAEPSGDGSRTEQQPKRESTKGEPPKRNPLPDWRKDPEAYGVALLARDSRKAVEVADAILSALFAITEASDIPLETANRMSSCPRIVAEAIEARKRVAELVTERDRLAEENAHLKAALERAKVPA
jgi:hypothetical protein